jgi:hypothetical protein
MASGFRGRHGTGKSEHAGGSGSRGEAQYPPGRDSGNETGKTAEDERSSGRKREVEGGDRGFVGGAEPAAPARG